MFKAEFPITAEEKIKRLRDGTVKRYVYYRCTRQGGKPCKESPLKEEDLVEQLLKIIEGVSINELGTIEIVKSEMEKFKKLLSVVSMIDIDQKTIQSLSKIDVHACAKHILREGSKEDKRKLLDQLKSRIVVKGKKLEIEKVKKS